MTKLNLILFIILNSIQSHGIDDISFINVPTENECMAHGKNYKTAINPKCKDIILNVVSGNNRVSLLNDHIEVVGHRNLLFIDFMDDKKHQQLYLISGENSLLENIVTVDLHGQKILTLNRKDKGDSEILIFPFASGNIMPSKVIRGDFQHATHATFGPQGEYLYLALGREGKILKIQSKSDSRSVSAIKRPHEQVILNADSAHFAYPVAMDFFDSHHLMVLCERNKKIYTFNVSAEIPQLTNIFVHEDIEKITPLGMRYLGKNKLEVYGHTGQRISLQLDKLRESIDRKLATESK